IAKHAMRSVLTPIVTVFGLDLGALLGGAILTESVFSLPGLGKLSIDAVNQKDLPIILGVTTFLAFFVIFANLIVDVLYTVIDPRVRVSRGGRRQACPPRRSARRKHPPGRTARFSRCAT